MNAITEVRKIAKDFCEKFDITDELQKVQIEAAVLEGYAVGCLDQALNARMENVYEPD